MRANIPVPYCKQIYSRKDSLDNHLRNKHVGDQIMEARSNLNNMDTATQYQVMDLF